MIKINNKLFKPEYFPDGTMKLVMDERYDGEYSIEWFYDSEDELLQLYYIVNNINESNCLILQMS